MKRQYFCKQICQLCYSINILNVDIIQLLVLTYWMINYVNVLCLLVEFRIVNKPNYTLIIVEDVHGLALLVMQVCKELIMPNNILCNGTCCHILRFGSRGRDTIFLFVILVGWARATYLYKTFDLWNF